MMMMWVVVGAIVVVGIVAMLFAGSLAEPGGPDDVAPGHDDDD
jgi:hypothetical protein